MTLNTFGDNPVTPGVNQSTFVPDQLIAGDMKVVTDTVTFTGGAVITRGSVLGQVLLGAAVYAAGGGNTGNGTVTAIALGSKAKPGAYTIRWTGATTFEVINPNGVDLKQGTAAGAYSDPEIGFTFTAGGVAMVAGDTGTITVAAGAGGYKLATAAATDGSQTPVCLAADTVDVSGGDLSGPVYLQGEFNSRAVTLGTGITSAAAKSALQLNNIYLKSTDSAADPS